MSDEEWCEVLLKLLEYFDDREGTTYLYHDSNRQYFVHSLNVSDDMKAIVRNLLDEYHAAARGRG